MSGTSTFAYVTFIRTTPEQLWSALTNPELTRQYWFGMYQLSHWTAGAPWQLVFADGRIADSGEVLESEPARRLVLKWRNEFKPEMQAEGYSRCVIEIEPVGDVAKLSITHTLNQPDSRFVAAVSAGWPRILSNLKSWLETGTVLFAEKF
ncbi:MULTISPECIES: SRPBCC family protein [Silvimonas]|uniref:SRPBCC family protein n=1 Tax=Silvimonas TaxID=300264 RepID=UPI0024B35410|nr:MULTISPECIES: SRPBCC family protein [Silvimonas]MDR3427469.1 SRPBCC family protein [Silvimonas sp.]